MTEHFIAIFIIAVLIATFIVIIFHGERAIKKGLENQVNDEDLKNVNLKTYQNKGMKRLSILTYVFAFVISFFILVVNENRFQPDEAFLEFPIISLIIALTAWCFTRGIYWVIDGLKSNNEDD